jgi:hypothetical protein
MLCALGVLNLRPPTPWAVSRWGEAIFVEKVGIMIKFIPIAFVDNTLC